MNPPLRPRSSGYAAAGARAGAVRYALLASAAWLALGAPVGPALGQTVDGYEVERTQSVQTAPPGSVGRKTVDRSHSVGTREETLGNELTYVLTFGGFARQCPSSAGFVDGDFEYSIAYDSVDTGDDGVIRREHHVRRLVAQIKGEVDDQAKLVKVELTGNFTVDRSGDGIVPEAESRPVRTTFTPGPRGEPDFPAMEAAVQMTADIAVASVILTAGTMYRDAEAHWRTPNECAELAFDPPTDTQHLRPNEQREVRAALSSKGDGSPVRWMTDSVNVITAGTVTPRNVPDASSASVTFKYTASARPRTGNGIDVLAYSRAGVANDKWRIVDRYEGTFSQISEAQGAVSVVSGATSDVISGRLMWIPDSGGQHAKSFGDVPSVFYKATEGELKVELSQATTGVGGSRCEGRGEHTFALSELPQSKVQYLLLEIATDGRYKLTLGIPDYPETLWEMDVVCTFPRSGSATQRVTAMLPAVMIGVQQGRLDVEQAVVGEMTQQRGPMRTTGRWSFKLAE